MTEEPAGTAKPAPENPTHIASPSSAGRGQSWRERVPPPVAVPRQAAEVAAYIGIAALALGLRLAGLGAHPLSDAEASQALVAWRILHNQAVGGAGHYYSPLVATLNLIGFGLLGGSDVVARLGPALLGSMLVLLPYGLRQHLGRSGGLAAAVLFALSPIALHFSRVTSGDIGAVVGSLAVVVGMVNWLERLPGSKTQPGMPQPWLSLAAGGLVFMLTAAPSSYSILILWLGFLVALVAAERGYADRIRTAARQAARGWRDLFLGLIVGLLAVATALMFNAGGLAVSVDLLTGWVREFLPMQNTVLDWGAISSAGYPAIFVLSFYEPLVLLAGLFGLATAMMRRRLIDLLLGWWFLGAILLDLVRTGRTPGDVLVPLVPMVLLAGLALGRLWDSVRREGRWDREGLVAAAGLVMMVYAYVELMAYTKQGGLTFLLPVAALGLFAGLVAVFWMWHDGDSTLRGAAAAAVVALLAFSVAASVRLNYGQVTDARQPLVRAPAAAGLRDLVVTLERVSSKQVNDPFLLDITVSNRVGPAVEWQLRHFDNVAWVDSLERPSQSVTGVPPEPASNTSEAMISTTTAPVSVEGSYLGQDFAVRAQWSPIGLDRQSLIRWIVLHTASTPISYDTVVLWVKQDAVSQMIE